MKSTALISVQLCASFMLRRRRAVGPPPVTHVSARAWRGGLDPNRRTESLIHGRRALTDEPYAAFGGYPRGAARFLDLNGLSAVFPLENG